MHVITLNYLKEEQMDLIVSVTLLSSCMSVVKEERRASLSMDRSRLNNVINYISLTTFLVSLPYQFYFQPDKEGCWKSGGRDIPDRPESCDNLWLLGRIISPKLHEICFPQTRDYKFLREGIEKKTHWIVKLQLSSLKVLSAYQKSRKQKIHKINSKIAKLIGTQNIRGKFRFSQRESLDTRRLMSTKKIYKAVG